MVADVGGLLLFQVNIQRMGIRAVYVNFAENGKLRVKLHFAHLGIFRARFGGLFTKLVAREIQYFQALRAVLGVKLLQLLVLLRS